MIMFSSRFGYGGDLRIEVEWSASKPKPVFMAPEPETEGERDESHGGGLLGSAREGAVAFAVRTLSVGAYLCFTVSVYGR